MTILTAILCRAFGHKPYEHPHIDWVTVPGKHWKDAQRVMVKRCKRCSVKLGSRPMGASEDE